ncbi:hypothetical protein ABT001_24570 [Streptomyces sp. NPDC002793]|uniref:hypothetical protein n=1 Tax=Streptomyces sp. NPDC002793 TaxID=3154432 RepID=UPI003316EE22
MTDRVAHQLVRDEGDIVRTGAQTPAIQRVADERPRLPQALRPRAHTARGESRGVDAEIPRQLHVRVRTAAVGRTRQASWCSVTSCVLRLHER